MQTKMMSPGDKLTSLAKERGYNLQGDYQKRKDGSGKRRESLTNFFRDTIPISL
jgi:hypothetical protein